VALRIVESCEDDDERRGTTMAETKRMTTAEVVGSLLEGEGVGFLRESQRAGARLGRAGVVWATWATSRSPERRLPATH
jgi:hypothetical protein